MISIEKIRSGDRRSLARAITLVESTRADHRAEAEQLLAQAMPFTGGSLRIGITGVPGVGKSTFIDSFGRHVVGLGQSIAVLTVDPSSSITGGSILGDKTRMSWLSTSDQAFIRPSPAGLTLGGVARRTREALLLCEAAGYDLVLVETVGVGQSETVVAEMTDIFLLLLLPAAGDDLQGIKRGIMELADLVVVNKADGDLEKRAGVAASDVKHALNLTRPRLASWQVPVLTASALLNHGIDQIWQSLLDCQRVLSQNDGIQTNRRRQSLDWLWRETGELMLAAIRQDESLKRQLEQLQQSVQDEEIPASIAARNLVNQFLDPSRRHD